MSLKMFVAIALLIMIYHLMRVVFTCVGVVCEGFLRDFLREKDIEKRNRSSDTKNSNSNSGRRTIGFQSEVVRNQAE